MNQTGRRRSRQAPARHARGADWDVAVPSAAEEEPWPVWDVDPWCPWTWRDFRTGSLAPEPAPVTVPLPTEPAD